jgi:ATP-dependent helicase/nuclease subunit B
VQIRFLLGPSGSGKTFRLVTGAQAALQAAPSGPPLLYLCPKQATFQVERQMLANPSLCGYTRLRILSFDRLAEFVLASFGRNPALLNDEGRLMVLRALLSQKREHLKLFRATARLRGFAQQLNDLLRELQRAEITPDQLLSLNTQEAASTELNLKLQDIASLLRWYLDWLKEHDLQDADQLLSLAANALRSRAGAPAPRIPNADSNASALKPHVSTPFHIAALWCDGFAELAPQELRFLTMLLPSCDQATLAFNLERESLGAVSWLSPWSTVSQTFRRLHALVTAQPDTEVQIEWLDRDCAWGRFAQSTVLQHLERNWSNPTAFASTTAAPTAVSESLRLVACPNPEAEAKVAAREILRYVRTGGRYRHAAVIARRLEDYADAVRRVFGTFEIPFFLDRREAVGHHPLLELTRNALRTIAYRWQGEDWFGALKTGLVHPVDTEIDRLENEALARGWTGEVWLKPLEIPDAPELANHLEGLRQKILPAFLELASAVGTHVSGRKLATALAAFWDQLDIAGTLQAWSSRPPAKGFAETELPVHVTVWEQMQQWLENLTLAFDHETLPLREWFPVLEAGLANQTVGLIPPTLDQVLVGSVDRSRNPDIELALVLGMNETVFPAGPRQTNLLTTREREELVQLGVDLRPTVRHHLAQERYLGYIACTRARKRLVLTWALRDEDDKSLNPSPILDHLARLFPDLPIETASAPSTWTDAEHWSELSIGEVSAPSLPAGVEALPQVKSLHEQIARLRAATRADGLAPQLAESLYGSTLETSVSRLEEYAACPFRFWITSGLHADERKLFRLDVREQGSFQHEVLARFHHELQEDRKRWRDLTSDEARQRIARIAQQLIPQYQAGLLEATEQTRFMARSLSASLQAFIGAIIDWMPQYQFDPEAVELAFGIEEKPLPAWEMELGDGHRLSFRGKIDRVDLWRDPAGGPAWAVVLDYKSSARKLDPLLVAHGIQLQLLAYLNVLRSFTETERVFAVKDLRPAGVFYVNLRGQYPSARTRTEALAGIQAARAAAYQHTGRFDISARSKLDARTAAQTGDQFKYRLCKDGSLCGGSHEALDSASFTQLLQNVENHLKRMGREIYAGKVQLDPYRKGNVGACDRCQYQPICRIDPWTHSYRVLRAATA